MGASSSLNVKEGARLLKLCERGDMTSVEKLLWSKPCLKGPLDTDGTVLLLACKSGNVRFLHFLLQNGTDASIPSDNSELPYAVTPLHAACLTEDAALVRLLLVRGAPPDTPDLLGHTALHTLYLGHQRVIRDYRGVPELARGSPNVYTLQHSSRVDMKMVEALVGAGADVGAADCWGETPLHYSCLTLNVPLTRALLEAGADPSRASRAGNAPLHQLYRGRLPVEDAAELRTSRMWRDVQHELYELLLTSGADANTRDCWGGTPLHNACATRDVALAELLLEHGADPDKWTQTNQTALHKLYSSRSPLAPPDLTLLRALLSHGADPNSVTKVTRSTPLMVLAENVTYTPDERHLAAMFSHIRVLVDAGADTLLRSRHERTLVDVNITPVRTYIYFRLAALSLPVPGFSSHDSVLVALSAWSGCRLGPERGVVKQPVVHLLLQAGEPLYRADAFPSLLSWSRAAIRRHLSSRHGAPPAENTASILSSIPAFVTDRLLPPAVIKYVFVYDVAWAEFTEYRKEIDELFTIPRE